MLQSAERNLCFLFSIGWNYMLDWNIIKPFVKLAFRVMLAYVFAALAVIFYVFIYSLVSTAINKDRPNPRVEGAVLAPVAFGNPFLPYRDVTPRITSSSLHGYTNWTGRFSGTWPGIDYATPIGTPLYAPEICPCIVEANGFDGYVGQYDRSGTGKGTSYIVLTTEDGVWKIMYQHGIYTVSPGDIVAPGVKIGTEASVGNSTGPHTHLSLKKNGVTVNVRDYDGTAIVQSTGTKSLGNTSKTIQHTGRSGRYGSVLSTYEGVSIRMSHYDPSLGGINCDHDCSTMASGEKVASWVLGQNGKYAAACPQEIPFGTKIRVNGTTFICKDRGGWINAYDIGDYDPAMKRNADTRYFWIDTLGTFGYSYGQLVPAENWGFVP
jgi:hypothetical protein